MTRVIAHFRLIIVYPITIKISTTNHVASLLIFYSKFLLFYTDGQKRLTAQYVVMHTDA